VKRISCLIFLLCCPLWANSFHIIAGSEIDSSDQSFSYIGFLKDFKLLGSSYIVVKLWGDYLSYTFSVNGDRVKAQAPAFQGGIGLKFVTDLGIFSIIPGWESRNTTISPNMENVKVKGISEGAVIVADAYLTFPGRLVLTAVGSYSTSISYAWGRIRLLKGDYFGNLKFGAEIIGQGNYDYESLQLAPILEFARSNYSLILRSGYKKSSAGESIYGGVDFYIGF